MPLYALWAVLRRFICFVVVCSCKYIKSLYGGKFETIQETIQKRQPGTDTAKMLSAWTIHSGQEHHHTNSTLLYSRNRQQNNREEQSGTSLNGSAPFLLLSVWIKILFSVHNTEAATQQALKPDAYSNHSGSRGECFCYDLPGKHLLSVSLCPVPSALIWCRIYSFTAWNE